MVDKVVSAMRPTGRLHIGHMVGALDNWVDLQEKYDCYFFVADWHALTTETDTKEIKPMSIEMVKDWLAAGIDPERSTIFVQSQVPQHSELHLIFSMLNTLPRLERMPTFKGQLKHLEGIIDPEKELTQAQINNARSKISYGFLGYPVLQSADILVYKGNKIPVGEDQLPHIELTREIARSFNRIYGNVFPEPEALLTNTPRVLGTDGRKMSKSYGNAIIPDDNPQSIEKKVRTMITDPQRKRLTDPGDSRVCSVYDLHIAYTPLKRELELSNLCKNAGIGCTECKRELAENISKKYESFRERRKEIESDDKKIYEILKEGSAKAKRIASETLKEVKEHMLMDYW